MKFLFEKNSETKNILAILAENNEVGYIEFSLHVASALQRKGFVVGLLHCNFSLTVADKMESQGWCSSSYRNCCGIKIASIDCLNALDDAMVMCSDVDVLVVTMNSRNALGLKSVLSGLRVLATLIITAPATKSFSKPLKEAISMLKQIGSAFVGVVENMSHFIEPISKVVYYPMGQGRSQRLALNHGLSFLGEIPMQNDVSIPAFPSMQVKSPLVWCYDKLLGRIIEKMYLPSFYLAPCM